MPQQDPPIHSLLTSTGNDTIVALQQRVEELTTQLNTVYERLQREMEESQKVHEALQESEVRLQAVISQAPIVLWTLDREGRFTFVEGKGLENSGIQPSQVLGQSIFDVCAFQPQGVENITRVFTGSERSWISETQDLVYENRATPLRDRNDRVAGIIGVSTDVTQRQQSETALHKVNEELERRVEERTAALRESNDQLVVEIVERSQAEKALCYRVELEQLIARLSTQFINLNPDDIDRGIDGALEAIASFCNVDRSYVLSLDEAGTSLNNTHEWCAPGVDSQIQRRQQIPITLLDGWRRQIDCQETIYIPSTTQLPRSQRTAKAILQLHAIQSLIAVPMTYRDSLVGFLGFDSVRVEKNWSEDIIALLKIVGEMFVNALERKRTKEALRESEKKYRNLVETSQNLIWSVDLQGRFTFVNQAVRYIYGYEPSQMIGRFLTDFMPVEERGKATQIFEKLLNEASETDPVRPYPPYELIHRRRDGTPIHLIFSSLVHKGENGTLFGIVGTATDISDRKRSEAALQQAKDQLQAVLDAVPGFISWTDSNLRYLGVNQQLANAFSLPPEQFVGQEIGFLDRHSEFTKFIRQFFAESTSQASKELEIEINGFLKHYLIVAQKYHQDTAIVSVGIDISDRKRAEAQKTQLIAFLQESESKYRSLYEATSDAVILLDSQICFECNRAAVEMFGCTSQTELIGKSLSEFSPLLQPCGQDSLSLERERIATTLQTGSCRFEWLHQRLDSSEFPAEVLLTAMEINGIQVLQGVVRDITERKRNEAEIQASLAEKEVLLKEIHHRVKNNLQVISSLLQLQSRYIQDREVLEMLKESQNRVRSMALVHEQLYQSKDLFQINFAEYINNLAKNLLSAYEVNQKRVKLNTKIAAIYLNVDIAVPCGLIINELISNSLKHAFPETMKGEISISFALEPEGSYWLLIGDNGKGFPKDLDWQKSRSLGFRLVGALVKQLRGSIELKKTVGTVFSIKFSQSKLTGE